MKIVFAIISLLCLTFLRPLLLIAFPLFVVFFYFQFKLKLSIKDISLICAIVVLGLLSSLLEGNFLLNYTLSLYFLLPILFLVMGTPKITVALRYKNLFYQFFKVFWLTLVLVNISAILYASIAVWSSEYPEDVFTGLYGSGGFGSHSLSVINLMMSAYFLFQKKYIHFTFFVICGITGFFGLGLLIYILALLLVMLPLIIRSIIKFFKVIVAILALLIVMFTFKLGNYDYLKVNLQYAAEIFNDYSYSKELEKMRNDERTFVPRYLTFMHGSYNLLFSNTKVFLLGTSPGTYNSRIAFYLNGDFIGNTFIRKHFKFRTSYHNKYVYPMMNRAYLANTNWNDGTRNQPFSSIASILLEYGFVLGCLIIFVIFRRFRSISKQLKDKRLKNFIAFLLYFSFLLCFLQYYLEVFEIILPVLLIIKLLEIDLLNNSNEPITIP